MPIASILTDSNLCLLEPSVPYARAPEITVVMFVCCTSLERSHEAKEFTDVEPSELLTAEFVHILCA